MASGGIIPPDAIRDHDGRGSGGVYSTGWAIKRATCQPTGIFNIFSEWTFPWILAPVAQVESLSDLQQSLGNHSAITPQPLGNHSAITRESRSLHRDPHERAPLLEADSDFPL